MYVDVFENDSRWKVIDTYMGIMSFVLHIFHHRNCFALFFLAVHQHLLAAKCFNVQNCTVLGVHAVMFGSISRVVHSCLKQHRLYFLFAFTDPLLTDMTLCQLEKSIDELKGTVASLTARLDQLESMEERLKKVEQQMQSIQHLTFPSQ